MSFVTYVEMGSLDRTQEKNILSNFHPLCFYVDQEYVISKISLIDFDDLKIS